MDLSIICVNWNSLDYLRACIPSVYKYTHNCSFEFIVVDNASPEGGVDRLKEEFPDIQLIKSNQNLGFAGANNLGFKHSSGKHILFLNPDTKLNSPAIETMLSRMPLLTNAGIVGCKLLNADLSVQTSSIMKFPTILNILLQSEYLRLRWPKLWGIAPLFADDPQPASVEAVSGACMLVDRDVFGKVGMFSEDYFMYSEDLDLCYKTKQAGLLNYFVGDTTIIHFAGKSSPSKWQTVMKLKSELRFCAKHYGETYCWLFQRCLIMNASLRLLVISFVSIFARNSERRVSMMSLAVKWKTILTTLLDPGCLDQDPFASPTIAAENSVSKI